MVYSTSNPLSKPVPFKSTLHPSDFQHEFVQAGNLKVHTVVEGPPVGAPLVVMLHGFPEFWYSWRFQIKPLAAAGYRVAAPDMRGYNLTENHGPYDPLTIVEDTANFIKALGYEKAHIIGHDWGGMIAWLFAMCHPEMTDKLIVCNLPHPKSVSKALRSLYLPQYLKSWYIGFFQLPVLPEMGLTPQRLSRLMKAALPNITEEELTYYREAWSQPGAIHAELGYYRSLPRLGRLTRNLDKQVHVPARLIWGHPDIALDRKLAEWSPQWCDNLDVKFIEPSTHFVQLSDAEKVTEYMLSFLR